MCTSLYAHCGLLPRAIPTICGATAFQPPPDSPGVSDGSQTRRAPDREPAGQLGLELQVAADHALDLQLERVVPALAGQRGERVERAALVQVDQREPALLIVP